MKKLVLVSLFLSLLTANFIFVGSAEARHNTRPWCYLLFQDCKKERDTKVVYVSSPSPSTNSGGNPVSTSPVNHPPVWSSMQTAYAVRAGDLLQFTVSATDLDNDTLTYNVSYLPSGASFYYSIRTFSWRPSENQTGTYQINFSVSDGQTHVTQAVTIEVLKPLTSSMTSTSSSTATPPVNRAPVFVNFNPPIKALTGRLYSYDLSAVDADNDSLYFSLISGPAGLTVDSATGLVQWTPADNQLNFNYVTVSVSDGKTSTSISFYIFVEKTQTVAIPAPSAPAVLAATAPAKPVLFISDMEIVVEENGEIAVLWKTNIPARARVIYDTKSQADRSKDFTYANATPETKVLVREHKIILGKLAQETVYYLRAVAKTDDQVVVSREMTFVQLPGGRVEFFGTALLFDILGPILFHPAFLVMVIIILGVMLYFQRRKQNLTIK